MGSAAGTFGGSVIIGMYSGAAGAGASYGSSWLGLTAAKGLGANVSTAGFSLEGMGQAMAMGGLVGGAMGGAVWGGIHLYNSLANPVGNAGAAAQGQAAGQAANNASKSVGVTVADADDVAAAGQGALDAGRAASPRASLPPALRTPTQSQTAPTSAIRSTPASAPGPRTTGAPSSQRPAAPATGPVKGAETFYRNAEEQFAAKTTSRGYDRLAIETKSGTAVRASNATDDWDEFLGQNQTRIDPRDGLPDPDRIWSADGSRSIRFGPHEMNSTPAKFHYHRETWYPDHVDNVLQRVQK